MKFWQVSDVMTENVATVGENTPYREIVDALIARKVSAVPVVDNFDRVLGVVSEADLLYKIEAAGTTESRRMFEGRRRRAARIKASGRVARDLMTAPAITVLPDTSIGAAAKLMEHEQVKRLPVTNDLGRLIGIVTRSDLLKTFQRSDADIRADVVDWVLHRVLAVEEGIVRVEVSDGVVTLTGRLDRRTATETAVRVAAGVAGVMTVRDQLDYDFDDTFQTIQTGIA